MSISIEVTAVGDAAAIILPKDLLDRLRLRAGDRLQLSELADGIAFTRAGLTFADKVDLAEKIMDKRASLLRRLAE